MKKLLTAEKLYYRELKKVMPVRGTDEEEIEMSQAKIFQAEIIRHLASAIDKLKGKTIKIKPNYAIKINKWNFRLGEDSRGHDFDILASTVVETIGEDLIDNQKADVYVEEGDFGNLGIEEKKGSLGSGTGRFIVEVDFQVHDNETDDQIATGIGVVTIDETLTGGEGGEAEVPSGIYDQLISLDYKLKATKA